MKVYTNYWENRLLDVRKRHGSYKTEEEALEGIRAWWQINNETYSRIETERTNTGALEIIYDDPNYRYRIEAEEIQGPLPDTSYRLRTPGERQAKRNQHQLEDHEFLFDDLAEPYRDLILMAIPDVKLARQYTYEENGELIRNIGL